MSRLWIVTLVLMLLGVAAPAHAATATEVQTTWRLLDYIAVDYREAVADGRVIDQLEYDEMIEFSATVATKLGALPATPSKASLLTDSRALQSGIAAKAAPADIGRRAKALAGRLLAAYPVPLAPATAPDVARGAALYVQNCASCHGARGEGPPPAFAKLDPPPIAFADRERARDRSVFGLYQVVTQGLEGTAMQSYAALPEEDRWAVAFYSGTLAYGDAVAGERIWRSDADVRALVPDLGALVALTPAELEAKVGADRAAAVVAFLRSNPGAVAQGQGSNASLQLARTRLRESLAAYSRGDRSEANRLALSAYLDGFEPVEAVLATRDGALMGRVEQAMAGFRQAIVRGDSEELPQRLAQTEALLDEAEAALAPEAESAVATFLGSFAILLREGLEALLVVIAMIAFLRKAGRPEALRYVHGGWIAALVAGAGTWVVATYAIGISGASREITEGFGALIAAVVLLSVGVWMHGKAQANEWRRYIAAKMQGALSRGSAWFLFGLAFLVVYREAFETILFYAALWSEGNGGTILAGALAAVLVLAVIAYAMLRLSRTLPIAQFFRWSAMLIAVLAVVLIGKGIGALQEAGTIGITSLAGVPRVAMLGIFPTAEAIGAQLLMVAALLVGFRTAARPRAEPLAAR
ncbi:MAG: cytochrome c/FTR1 family iron permease [Pseudomonadota bacterium]|nr:FTR1 family protein [Sphingomonas sp.]MDQ3479405.1 cytochrome c/FTR1 family iron permease [Pseudomonadota bacterium]